VVVVVVLVELALCSSAEVKLDEVKMSMTWKHKMMKSKRMSRILDGL